MMALVAVTDTPQNRRPLKRKKMVVPWYNEDVFKKVYEYLFDGDMIKKKWAIEEIDVWLSISGHHPPAIEVSRAFASAEVNDYLHHEQGFERIIPLCDVHTYYTFAIIRFGAVIIKDKTDERKPATLIANHSEEVHDTPHGGLGVPEHLVKLRHDITHGCRPPLKDLRNAAKDCMEYLKQSYWVKEVHKVKNIRNERFDLEPLRELLVNFMLRRLEKAEEAEERSRFEVLTAGSFEKVVVDIDAEAVTYLKEMEHEIKQGGKQQFVKALLSPNVFIPDDEVIHDIDKYLLDTKWCDDPARNCYPLRVNRMIPYVPRMHIMIWYYVILLLHRNLAINEFLEELLLTQESQTNMGQKLLISWAMLMLEIHSSNKEMRKDEVKRLFYHKSLHTPWYSQVYEAVIRRADLHEDFNIIARPFSGKCALLDWQKLYQTAISHPCPYTAFLLPYIFSKIELDENSVQSYCYSLNLMAIFCGQSNYEPLDVDLPIIGQIFTVKDLIQAKKAKQKTDEEVMIIGPSEELDVWSIPEDERYKDWPLGLIIPYNEQEEIEIAEDPKYKLSFNHIPPFTPEEDEEYHRYDRENRERKEREAAAFQAELQTELEKRKKKGFVFHSSTCFKDS